MPVSSKTPSRYPGSVLVIDDDLSARQLLERVLGGVGHRVTLATTGEAGLALLEVQPFDLLMTDKNLPGLGGLEVLRLARTRFPDLQVVLMTGFPTLAAQQEAMRLGAVEWVTKPFGILEVLAICDGAIQIARRHRAAAPAALDRAAR